MSGEGSPLPNRTLNRHTESNFENTSEFSATLGGMMNYNAATDDVTSHHLVGVRAGDASFNYQNDMGGLPGLPFVSGGTDQGWTASGMLDVSLGEGSSAFIGYSQFTGIADGLPPSVPPSSRQGTYHTHTKNRDSNLNWGETSVGFTKDSGSVYAGNNGSFWGQNLVHDYVKPQPKFVETQVDEAFFDFVF